MKKEYKPGRHIYRLPPCPAFDVELMESWLSDMAREGLLLQKDGFFAGVAAFEASEPRHVKYRLEAAQKSTSMWAENGGEPNPEQLEISEKYHWEYVAKRGDFYIYRSFVPDARELNTDPEVQALALNTVRRRRGGAALWLLLWLICYPLLLTRGGVLLSIISMKTWFFLLTAAFVLWVASDGLSAFISLGRLQSKLRNNGILASDRSWRKRSVRHHVKTAAQIALAIIIVCIIAGNWNRSVMNEDKTPLSSYNESLPFATMQAFAGEPDADYKLTMTGLGSGFNSVKQWSDWLAPRCIEYNEHARVSLADGRVLDGGLYVDYYETTSPVLARRLAAEYYRLDKSKKGFEPMETPELDADFALAYISELHFPVILIQKGNVFIRAFFYQASSNYTMEFEDWTAVLADSIG